jgi:uncharacterized SAM-binding protein YcdF (DUF218 family)
MAGLCSGIFLLFAAVVILFMRMPSLLIVDDMPQKSDLIVVLGGGTSSRFRKGLALHDAGFSNQFLLVDSSRSDWMSIQQETCGICQEIKIAFLEGSRDTFTDAELTSKYCRTYSVKSILVVTDPYHSRRAALIFKACFAGSQVAVRVISSGYFGGLLRPDQKWWQDNATLKIIWTEAAKNCIILLRNYGILAE